MRYANGVSISRSEGNKNGIKTPRKEWTKGNYLNAALINNGDTFADLYDLWISPCIELMRELNAEEPEERILPLFYENADVEKGESFLRRFTQFILGRAPYHREILPSCPHERVGSDVDDALPDTPDYLKLRIKVICILLGVLPEQAFAEGINWFGSFLLDTTKEDYFEIVDGMQFPLSFEHIEGLFPRTLHNDSSIPCRIGIVCKSAVYEIKLPAHGFLRAVFSNEKCDFLVSIKGNISFNGSETRNAVIQLVNQEQPSLFMCHSQYRKPFELEIGDFFIDASADGQGGAAVVTNHGLYYTRNDKVVNDNKRPIRVYGAGTSWAIHYEDGTLKCNLRKKGGISFDKALAVVENEDRSLLIKDETGFWDCYGGIARETSEEHFVQCMMERFLCKDVCERVQSSLMEIGIRNDGRLEVK